MDILEQIDNHLDEANKFQKVQWWVVLLNNNYNPIKIVDGPHNNEKLANRALTQYLLSDSISKGMDKEKLYNLFRV